MCNCSVNTCLSRLGECGGGETPHSNALEPLIEQPIAIYFLTVAGWEGANTRNPWLMQRLPDFAVVNSVSPEPILSQEAEPVAHKGDREVCVYVEQVVLCWLLVFVGAGCVCAARCKALLPLWNLSVDREHLGAGRASILLGPHMYTEGGGRRGSAQLSMNRFPIFIFLF